MSHFCVFISVSLTNLIQDVIDVDRTMQDLKKQSQQKYSDNDPNDKFQERLKDFLESSKSSFDELKAKKQEMESSFKGCVEFFGEESKTATPESFFGVFNTFMKNLEVTWICPYYLTLKFTLFLYFHSLQQKARKENEKESELQKKKLEQAAKIAEKEKAKQVSSGKMSGLSFGSSSVGVLVSNNG